MSLALARRRAWSFGLGSLPLLLACSNGDRAQTATRDSGVEGAPFGSGPQASEGPIGSGGESATPSPVALPTGGASPGDPANPVDPVASNGPWTVDANGHATVCSWQGYTWTVAGPEESGVNGTVSNIAPIERRGQSLCTAGVVAAHTDYGGFAVLGVNVGQGTGADSPNVAIEPVGAGVEFSVSNSGDSELRLQIQNDSAQWCALLTGSTGFVPWADFDTECWSTTSGTAYAMQPIDAVVLLVPGDDTNDTDFEFCLNRLGPDACEVAPSGPSAAPAGPADVVVTLDDTVSHQTLEGFGAALAWYQGALLGHPQRAALMDIVFAELGLDILRFRNRYQRSNGSDGNLDEEVQLLAAATASLGRAPRVLITSWSPPAALKANGREDCAGESSCTLRRENGQFVYEAFADYWVESLAQYQSLGIAADYISIQNEPDFIPSSWEGCRFEPSETSEYPGYAEALAAVAPRVATLPNAPRLLGPETLGVHYDKVQNYMDALDPTPLFGVAHHLYERGSDDVWDWRDPGPDSYTEAMLDAKSGAGGLPLFQTEFQTDEDGFTDGGFETAWLIHNSLVEEEVVAWLYWDLIWDGSGLVALQGNGHTIRDQYYSLRHYAAFTDPGYVRTGASSSSNDVRVSAYRAPDGTRLTVVLLNAGASDVSVAVESGSFVAESAAAYRTVYRPGSSEQWRVQTGFLDQRVVDLPSRSVATVVFQR